MARIDLYCFVAILERSDQCIVVTWKRLSVRDQKHLFVVL